MNFPVDRARNIRLLALDVDGTLTDGTIQIIDGKHVRRYSILDGFGIKDLMRAGVEVAVITASTDAEGGEDIRVRMNGLGVRQVHIGIRDKKGVLRQIMEAQGLDAAAVAYAGDDIPDLEAMRMVGLACAPQTAVDEILAVAHYVMRRPAGQGAIRELTDHLLLAQGKR